MHNTTLINRLQSYGCPILPALLLSAGLGRERGGGGGHTFKTNPTREIITYTGLVVLK